VSLLVSAVTVVCGVAAGRLIGRALRARARRPQVAPSREPAASDAGEPFERFPCRLGDVIVRHAERDEAWLAGALLFTEDRPVAALFVAPEVPEDRAVFARDEQTEIAWLRPDPGPGDLSGRDPPNTLECGGVRFERKRRLPVRVQRLGTRAPTVGATAIVAEYAGPGAQRLVLVAGADATLAWRGVALLRGEYDVLPGGPGTA
jgi:hypothetical protein